MVRPIARAPVPYPSPMFPRTGVSPLYAGAMAAGPAAGGGFPDWLSQLTSGLHNNSNALIGLGTGLLSSPTFAGGLAAGGQGWAQGNQTDRALKIQDYQMGLASTGRKAADEYVTKLGHPELVGAFASVGDAVAANKPNVFAPGSTATSGFGDPMSTGAGSNSYFGGSMEAQNWNLVMKAQSDQTGQAWNDPAVQAAWAQITQPKITYQQTPNGLVPVMQPPNIPPGWGPPQGSSAPTGQSPAGGAPMAHGGPSTPMGTDVAPIGSLAPAGSGISVGGALPGTKPAGTESQLRYKTITNILQAEVPNLQKNWKGLSDPLSQAAGVLPGDAGRILQSPTYKRAFDSVTASIANILYALSGASSNPGEVQKQGQVLMPHFGDDPETQRASFDRMKTYMQSVADGTGDPQVIAQTQEALQQLNFDTAGGGATQPPQQTAAPTDYKTKYGLD